MMNAVTTIEKPHPFAAHVAKEQRSVVFDELVRFEHEVFGSAATALDLDGVLWISSFSSDRIAYLRR